MLAIFFRPSSPPSFWRRSRAGMPMHSSCMIMDELIYGVMDSANTVAREKALPDMAL